MIQLTSVRFRCRGGRFNIDVPKGSKLLHVYQHASSYWYVDLAAPLGETATESFELCLLMGKETADIDLERWQMVGQATSLQGRTSYVFHEQPRAKKRSATKPRKAVAPATVAKPPVDAD